MGRKAPIKPQPMRMTAGFAIHVAKIATKWRQARQPTAEELVKMTAALPDLFPRAWTLDEAKRAIDNPNEIVQEAP